MTTPIIDSLHIAPFASRPKCRLCKKPLKPYVIFDCPANGPITRTFSGKYGVNGDGEFCSVNCGYQWGRSIAQSLSTGEFRITRNHQ